METLLGLVMVAMLCTVVYGLAISFIGVVMAAAAYLRDKLEKLDQAGVEPFDGEFLGR